jgi:NhaP-type Na+/H+ or K+/H+ antiporter
VRWPELGPHTKLSRPIGLRRHGSVACHTVGHTEAAPHPYGRGVLEQLRKKSLRQFHDGLAWLMQITMFFSLGLLVFPPRLVGVAAVSLLIAVFLMLVARPVAVLPPSL